MSERLIRYKFREGYQPLPVGERSLTLFSNPSSVRVVQITKSSSIARLSSIISLAED